jgi:hypothetical protein
MKMAGEEPTIRERESRRVAELLVCKLDSLGFFVHPELRKRAQNPYGDQHFLEWDTDELKFLEQTDEKGRARW